MRNIHLIFVLAASLLPFATTQADVSSLSETGQTICSDAAGVVIACAATGQDGDHLAGMTLPNPRFTVGTGALADCITDNLTGLMWVRAPVNIPSTWTNALISAKSLTLCGFSDWRLSNVIELESLVNSGVANQAVFLNAQGFSGVQANPYWSSTSHVGNTAQAVHVDMNSGSVNTLSKSLSDQFGRPMLVWPVRTGQ
jgi:hypothetical protein